MKKLCIFLLSLLVIWEVKAQNVCAAEAGRADQAIREQYQQTIDYFLKLAAAARLKGIDPRRFAQVINGQVEILDLVQLAQDVSLKRDEGIQTVYAGFQACQRGVAPYQAIIEPTMFFLSGGLSQVVPDKALHIDASNLLAGTPFGGPSALIPQAREQIFSMLGIGGDVASVIRNPLQIGPGGPVRAPWVPMLGQGMPNIGLPNLPPIGITPPNVALPNPPPPIQLGNVGGHRVCIPWC